MADTGIYLDYAATTPVDPRVAQGMIECLLPTGAHGNPSSAGHAFGRRARGLVEAGARTSGRCDRCTCHQYRLDVRGHRI